MGKQVLDAVCLDAQHAGDILQAHCAFHGFLQGLAAVTPFVPSGGCVIADDVKHGAPGSAWKATRTTAQGRWSIESKK
jgi:hypothetical protein